MRRMLKLRREHLCDVRTCAMYRWPTLLIRLFRRVIRLAVLLLLLVMRRKQRRWRLQLPSDCRRSCYRWWILQQTVADGRRGLMTGWHCRHCQSQ